MRIRSFARTGLRRLYQSDQRRGLPPEPIEKLRRMLAFLQDMDSVGELRSLPTWKAHRLAGERRGTWSLHVTANWRLTFRIEDNELTEVNFEDCH
jgi:toxin HigB-1